MGGVYRFDRLWAMGGWAAAGARARGGHGGGGANPGHYTDWTLSPATGRGQPSPRRTETGVAVGIAAWAGPARPKDEPSNELTLITYITDEAY